MSVLYIGKVIKEKSSFGFRLKSIIRHNNESFELFYDYNLSDGKLIDDVYVDPFLVAILPYAMEHKLNIECENPISTDIYYAIIKDFIPSLSKYQSQVFNYIELINCKTMDRKPKKNRYVGTGASCGVDSLHTILSTNSIQPGITDSYKLTHLVVLNSGACSGKGGEESQKWFDEESQKSRSVAEELKLDFIRVNTNLMEFYNENHEKSGFCRIIGCILGMDNLIGKYYIASSYELGGSKYSVFDGPSYDDGYYAFFDASIFSNTNVKFMIIGNSSSRDDKVRFIADNTVAQKYLNVCWFGANNCGRCEKCLRTIGALYTINKLDQYGKCFDINDFYKHKTNRIAWMIKYSKDHPTMYYFLNDLRKDKKKEYNKAKLYYVFVVKPKCIVKQTAKKILPKSIQNIVRKKLNK